MTKATLVGAIVTLSLAGCEAATRYDTGAVVLDVSDSQAFAAPSETTSEFSSAVDALKQDNLGHAEALLDKSLMRNPRDPYALLAMGSVMERTGRIGVASDYYRSAMRYGMEAGGPTLSNGEQTTVSAAARSNLARLE